MTYGTARTQAQDERSFTTAMLTLSALSAKAGISRKQRGDTPKKKRRTKSAPRVSPVQADLLALERSGIRWWRKRKLRARVYRRLREMGEKFFLVKGKAPVNPQREDSVSVTWYGVVVPAWVPAPVKEIQLPTMEGGEKE